jgi:hypothetical protein
MPGPIRALYTVSRGAAEGELRYFKKASLR